MFDIDKMIQSIEANPAIWDVGSKQYVDKVLREKSWNDVGEKVFPGWSELTEEDREEHMRMMKNKWRHIRDNYIKFKNHCQVNGGNAKRKKYVYADALNFLQQVLVNRGIIDTFSAEEISENEMSSPFTDEHPREVVVETTPLPAPIQNNEPKVRPPLVRRKAPSSFISPCQRNMWIPYHCQQMKIEEMDADRSFLLSLLPDYNRLAYEQKIDFRLCTLQFVKNVNQPKIGKSNKALGNSPQNACCQSSVSNLHEIKQDSQGTQQAVTSQQRSQPRVVESLQTCPFPPTMISVEIKSEESI